MKTITMIYVGEGQQEQVQVQKTVDGGNIVELPSGVLLLGAPDEDLEHITYENGNRMFADSGMMLDENGNRSIFDDVDE